MHNKNVQSIQFEIECERMGFEFIWKTLPMGLLNGKWETVPDSRPNMSKTAVTPRELRSGNLKNGGA